MKKLLSLLCLTMLGFTLLFAATACNPTTSGGSASTQSEKSQSVDGNSSTEKASESSAATSSSGATTQSSAATEEIIVPSETKYNGTGDGIVNTKVFLVGDSTVCEYLESKETARYVMRNGYGMRLGMFLNDKVTIRNLALSGRSSKSFIAESNYSTLKNEICAGDYLIIGFGHNDEKVSDKARYTDPTKPLTDDTSFKYSLNEYYIKVAIEKGATPILCTPIVRLNESNNYTNNADVHIANGGDYAAEIMELGVQTGVTVIDLTSLTKELYASLGVEKAKELHAYEDTSKKPIDDIDNTHINAYGAQIVAKMIAEELKKSDNSLKNYVLATLPEPDKSLVVFNTALKEKLSPTDSAS